MESHLFLICALMVTLACQDTRKADLNDFKEVNLENLTAHNAPDGLEFVDNTWRPGKGWELVQSKDGQKIMLLQTGTKTGSAGYECKCNAGSGSCAVRKDIVMCIADECTDCKTVLKIYNQRITFDKANW